MDEKPSKKQPSRGSAQQEVQTRTQFELTRSDAARLQRIAAQLKTSEEDALHLAIQDYDADALEAEGNAMVEKMEAALDSAMRAVDDANENVLRLRKELRDPDRRAALEAEIRKELTAGPKNSLDEIAAAIMTMNVNTDGSAQ